MKITWIGTGVMGAPMASHLAKAGHQVTVYNRSPEKALSLEPLCTAVTTIKEAVKEAEVVFTMVGYPQDVREVYFSPDGILAHVAKDTIVVDMTTSSPQLAIEIAEEALKHQIIALDAPVTGGDLGAKNATLSIMVGGDDQAFMKIKPLLELLGTVITYLGEAGNGQSMKLANQICVAGAIASTAEALTFARSKGIQAEDFFNVINHGAAGSWQSKNAGPKMASEDFDPGFYIKHFVKDLNLVIQNSTSNIDLTALVLDHYQDLVEAGYENLGSQAIIKYYLDK